jgi:DEAD/DEAH box helicase domain-containing protein
LLHPRPDDFNGDGIADPEDRAFNWTMPERSGILAKKRRTRMNLTLGLTESSDPLGIERRRGSIESAVARFQEWMAAPDSPIRAIRHQPAREGEYEAIPAAIAPALRDALVARSIPKLYVHQTCAFELAVAGKNVVVVTPTASGKTLCYNLPVLQRLIDEPAARAMYLFPTKALAEDQLHELQAALDALGLHGGASEIRAFTYDGDTPQDARRVIRERANVVLTNPDMLHSGILPHHTKWAKCFENLRYIVIDELHYYRGVYGSHLANVLRRLRRIAEFYGSAPQLICCSATIANPKELAEAVTEAPFELVDRNGAPSGEKYFVFYNPPVVNKQLGIRRGYLQETRRIAVEFIERRHQTLVFANSRLATEILVKYLRDAIERGPLPGDAVRGYRGGYLPRERREIERKLRDGDIRAVVATNALELGVDIGSLDAVVMAGYPGSIASAWQRAGRAGRRQSASLAVMVASSAPLDQYVVEHPEYFFEGSPEHAHINADNLEILLNHLKCAAFELPIRDGEKFGPHDPAELCRFLAEDARLLHHSNGCWHWISDTYPADAVSLRAVSSDNFIVVDITGEHKVIAEVSFTAAPTTLHEKAIYLHEARQFQVEKLDFEGRKAYVRCVDSDYFTDAIDYTQVKELEEFESAPVTADANGARACHGEVRVNTQVVGFKKLKFYSMENIGAGHLSMPEQELHTTAFWLHFPAEFLARFPEMAPAQRQSGLTGLAQLLRTVGALLLMCDPRDLGVAITEDVSGTGATFEPDLFLFDNYPGGIGQSQPLFQLRGKLLASALEVLERCGCAAGCPACVGPIGEVGEAGKQATFRLLRELSKDHQRPDTIRV